MPAETARLFQMGTIPILVWSLVWKGMALWKAARRGEKYWFIALLILNTVGILEIVYLIFIGRKPKAAPGNDVSKKPSRKKRR